MTYSGTFYLWAAFCMLLAQSVRADDTQMQGGFDLGGTFEAAQNHARAQGWRLAPLSDGQPGSWGVAETGLTLFVCGNTVTSVSQRLDGDLEAFTALVFSMMTRLGEPDIRILSIPSGAGVISTIDARFFVTNGGGAVVQLQSIGGKRTFTASSWIASDCQ